MVGVAALRGYVLEELLARLLYDNGYRLLVSEDQDPEALKRGAHGLLVRGRGADHQADVLGELTLPVPFSLPVRIFVEAKYRSRKTGLFDVRNAHGVVHDVNEQFSTAAAGARAIPVRRYHYRYTLFSTSGFTKPAQQFALAQQISLVDLSSPAFARLLVVADRAARQLLTLAQATQTTSFPTGQVRSAFRLALGTWTADTFPDRQVGAERGGRAVFASEVNPARREPHQLPDYQLAEITEDLGGWESGRLLLGFPAAPFVLALRPDDPAAFSDYVREHGPDVPVHIEFARRREVTGDWVIVPAREPSAFTLRFALPELLEDWLLGDERAAALRARDVKSGLFSSIAVFQDGRVIRLLFQPRRRG
ncbi:restriction endonuclease [Lentzea sp. JNUCC 0626]|uniref:restriction endonuclease n=1 Tax=Lentzea sp. JNUCC 0626 TaxID=3367513 RepID=UPI00374A65D9